LSYNITAAHILPTTQIYFSQEYYSETDGWKKKTIFNFIVSSSTLPQ